MHNYQFTPPGHGSNQCWTPIHHDCHSSDLTGKQSPLSTLLQSQSLTINNKWVAAANANHRDEQIVVIGETGRVWTIQVQKVPDTIWWDVGASWKWHNIQVQLKVTKVMQEKSLGGQWLTGGEATLNSPSVLPPSTRQSVLWPPL
ncbi:hypothetical protein E2C01_081488 [Portunus trituberculatus]|uniref:Uncharacterized protein n=1 Tax=Portunus trituberculatus TaxID=210409 RepID=A0A5B7IS19_PORTR|nr:hypothetical protein [Portunus trituberculatus]